MYRLLQLMRLKSIQCCFQLNSKVLGIPEIQCKKFQSPIRIYTEQCEYDSELVRCPFQFDFEDCYCNMLENITSDVQLAQIVIKSHGKGDDILFFRHNQCYNFTSLQFYCNVQLIFSIIYSGNTVPIPTFTVYFAGDKLQTLKEANFGGKQRSHRYAAGAMQLTL